MAGKNKLLRGCRMYADQYDISGDSRTFSSLDYGTGEVDVHGWGEDMNYLSDGIFQRGIRGYQALVNDATGRSWDALKDVQQATLLTVAIGSGGAAPAAGDLSYHMPARQTGGVVDFSPGIGLITVDAVCDASTVSANYRRPLGVVLMPKTTISSTTNGTAVDNGASSANGWSAQLHVFSTTSGDFAFTIEHASSPPSYSTLGTFTTDGSSVGAEFLSGSGTVNQHVRFVATRTAGTVIVACVFARN